MGGVHLGVPQTGWFIMDNPISMDDDWGYPHDETETSVEMAMASIANSQLTRGSIPWVMVCLSRSKAMQVALTLAFSLSCVAVPTLIGDEAFGNVILTVAGGFTWLWLHMAHRMGFLFCVGWICVCDHVYIYIYRYIHFHIYTRI